MINDGLGKDMEGRDWSLCEGITAAQAQENHGKGQAAQINSNSNWDPQSMNQEH
jgi:hypothetical protein